MVKVFDPKELNKLYKPHPRSSGEDNGQVTIIGGSKLFHGAPILALNVASRIVDMVFFASPDSSVGRVAEKIKSKLASFIWVPWGDVEAYIEKSDAVLIGPGFMRYSREHQKPKVKKDKGEGSLNRKNYDKEGERTRKITQRLLSKFPNKRWVIDAGSLQVLDPESIPPGSIITPNKKEFQLLFGEDVQNLNTVSEENIGSLVWSFSKKYNCVIVLKGPETFVASPSKVVIIKGGNPGMTKGGTGDVLAGLTVALLAKNDPFLAAASSSFIAKRAADNLYEKVGVFYNADDLAEKIPETLGSMLN